MSGQTRGEMISPVDGVSPVEPAPRTASAVPAGDVRESSAIEPMWQVIRRLPRYARLSTALARDPRVPATSKAMLVAGGLYVVSPIDLVPGIIPVAGQLDDLYVLLLGLQQAIRTSPKLVIDEHFAAVDLDRASVDDDLATIRAFVRRGVAWSVRTGRHAISRLSRQARSLAQRARQRGEARHDKEPL